MVNTERRLRFFIYVRIVVSFLFLAFTLIFNLQSQTGATVEVSQPDIVRLMLFSFGFSIASLIALRLSGIIPFLTYLQVIWDICFVTILILFTGGILSPYSFLYLLSIMIAGLLLGRREALYTASLCIILYGALVDFQYFGYLANLGLGAETARQIGAAHLFYTLSINLIGFGLAAFITGYLAERARLSEVELYQKSINYDELSQLNSTIVQNIETGLLTTNALGRIRVFNPHAEMLTGMTLGTIYNASLEALFPVVWQEIAHSGMAAGGEFEYATPDGLKMIFGYSAAPFTGNTGLPAGYIVNFWDLTALRRMEMSLKRADRLAALGELSARMAHEIRNPLTALSGAVQLLADHKATCDADARLFTIVTRETDRLNKLIGEFLIYARPAPPAMAPTDLHGLIEDLRLLLEVEKRFQGVVFSNDVPAHATVTIDPDQFRQVLINLFHNAADSMPNGGLITVASTVLLRGADGFNKQPVMRIEVCDTGCGIDEETARHLFEPFWTTKPDGTGLGLAISYRIIESHGGTLTVGPATGGKGSCFTILLPLNT